MARAPIMAAGGIVIRGGARPRIAIVQRRKDHCWVLPKGKLKPGEKARAAARREVIEETGCDVKVHDFLGALTYDRGRKSKVVQFWRMETTGASGGELMRDIEAVRWLPLKTAVATLDDPLEAVFLRHIGRHVIVPSRARTFAKSRRAASDAGAPRAHEREPQQAQVMVANGPNIRPNLMQRALQLLKRATRSQELRLPET